MNITAGLLLATLPTIQSAGTETSTDVDAAVLQAARFLLTSQEVYVPDPPVGSLPEGELSAWQAKEAKRLAAIRKESAGTASEWPYEGVHRVGRNGRIPGGYRIGGSAIVVDALLSADLEGEDLVAAREAIERTVAFAMEAFDSDPSLARGPKKDYDVRGWGHAYGIQLFLLALEHGIVEGEAADEAREMVKDLIDRLQANVTKDGGWNYANDRSVSPFMTGSTLLILRDAKAAGFEVDEAMITKALDALEGSHLKETIYKYDGRHRAKPKMPASSARSSVATLALFHAGRKTEDDLRAAVQGFFDGWEDLLIRKSKQGTHKPPHNIAPYYFFYGHTYAAFAIEALPEAERPAHRAELARLLWKTRDEDGTWNDRVFPRTSSYSTAMSILALKASSH